jgi:hypothetical protein
MIERINYLKVKILIGLYIGLGVSTIFFVAGPVRKQLEYVLTLESSRGRVGAYIQDVIGSIYMIMIMMTLFFILGLYLIIIRDKQNTTKASRYGVRKE